jgi:hypothetical protein
VTIPDGTAFESGQYFTKTWRLQNAGSCAWTTAYDLIFVRGDRMDGSVEVDLPATVRPGETVDVTVSLRPQRIGYLYRYRHCGRQRQIFGIEPRR